MMGKQSTTETHPQLPKNIFYRKEIHYSSLGIFKDRKCYCKDCSQKTDPEVHYPLIHKV
jgi:hypothetical protein